MSETRKIAAILVSDVVGYSRLAGADEDRTLARLRALRSDLIDPTISVHHGRIVKRTGDGSVIEFRSVVDAVRCALEVQHTMVERNAGVPEDRRIEFRIGIHLGDVVEEADGDLMGDGVNIAARLERICEPGGICLSEDAYRQVKGRLEMTVSDLGPTQLKNIAEPMRIYSLRVGAPAVAKPLKPGVLKRPLAVLAGGAVALLLIAAGAGYFLNANRTATAVPTAATPAAPARLSIVVLPFTNLSNDPSQEYFADGVTENLTTELSRLRNSFVIARNTAFSFKGKNVDARDIGRQLGVRYVLEGSVQRDQNRVRVNAQLIDASPARIFGPTASRKTSPTCSSCKMKWWRDWPIAWAMNWSRPRRKRTPVPKTPTLSISPCAVGHWCGRNNSSSGRGRTTMRRKRYSNRRSGSTRTKPMRWQATLTPICWNTRGGGQPPGPTTRQKYSVRPTGPSRSPPIICGRIM